MSKFLTLEGLTYFYNKLKENFIAKSADKLTTPRSFSIKGGATASGVNFDGTGNVALNVTSLDATKLSGQVPLASIPPAALERLIVVTDDTARLALTNANVQNGDTVKVTATGKMYFVKDDSKLNTEDGYEVYTAGAASSVPWSGVTGKPSTFTPSTHTHTKSQITDFPTLATVATSGKYTDLTGAPTSLPANGGNAATVGGHTVEADVPANAKFTDTTYSNMTAATAAAAGKAGLVPAPAAGAQAKYLRGDGTWQTPPNTTYAKGTYNTLGLVKPSKSYTGAATLTTAGASAATAPTIAAISTTAGRYYAVEMDTNGVPFVNVPWSNTTYSAATTSANGLMTSTMVSKLNGVATGATADSAITTAEIDSIFAA